MKSIIIHTAIVTLIIFSAQNTFAKKYSLQNKDIKKLVDRISFSLYKYIKKKNITFITIEWVQVETTTSYENYRVQKKIKNMVLEYFKTKNIFINTIIVSKGKTERIQKNNNNVINNKTKKYNKLSNYFLFIKFKENVRPYYNKNRQLLLLKYSLYERKKLKTLWLKEVKHIIIY